MPKNNDIKKVLLWYNLLYEKELLDFTETVELKTEEKPVAESE